MNDTTQKLRKQIKFDLCLAKKEVENPLLFVVHLPILPNLKTHISSITLKNQTEIFSLYSRLSRRSV